MQRLILTSLLSTLAFYFYGKRPRGTPLYRTAVLVATLAVVLPSMGTPNYYRLLKVSPLAGSQEIAQAAQSAALLLHSRGISDETDPSIVLLERITKLLKVSTSRIAYNRYGDMFMDATLPKQNVTLLTVISLAVTYQILCFCLTCVLTMPKSFKAARSAIGVYCLLCFVLETTLRLQGEPMSFGGITFLPFEIVALVKRIFPAVLIICVQLSDKIYDNSEDLLRHQLKGFFHIQHLILQQSTELQNEIATLKART